MEDNNASTEDIAILVCLKKFFYELEKNDNVLRKSAERSTKTRIKGNDIYVSKNHNQNVHKMALSAYSLSVAFAPNDSEELALAYGNRSALLLHLHKYDECLIDIDRSLKITNSKELKVKLLNRKTKCLNLIENSNVRREPLITGNLSSTDLEMLKKQLPVDPQSSEKLELPKMVPSEEILCASESVAIGYNKKFGRHIIATRDMKPGEVYAVEKAYATSVNWNHISLVCAHCMCFAWTAIPCDNCVHVMYCSENCKEDAWAEYHDIECSILPFILRKDNAEVDMKNIILMAKILITSIKKEGLENVMNEAKLIDNRKSMHIRGFKHNGVFHSDKFRACYNLSRSQLGTKEEKIKDEYYATMIVHLLFSYSNLFHSKSNCYQTETFDNSTLMCIKNILIKLKRILKTNVYDFQGYACICPDVDYCLSHCDSGRASIIVPFCSLINHSCIPNSSRIFLPGRKIVLFTTEPIKKGEQLFDSYGPTVSVDVKERQTYMQKHRGFTCQCDACDRNWSYPKVPDLLLTSKFLTNLKKHFSPEKLMSLVKPTIAWTYDEETLKNAIEFCEIIYKFMGYNIFKALIFSFSYKIYIDKAFFKLYGEKCEMPHDC